MNVKEMEYLNVKYCQHVKIICDRAVKGETDLRIKYGNKEQFVTLQPGHAAAFDMVIVSVPNTRPADKNKE